MSSYDDDHGRQYNEDLDHRFSFLYAHHPNNIHYKPSKKSDGYGLLEAVMSDEPIPVHRIVLGILKLLVGIPIALYILARLAS